MAYMTFLYLSVFIVAVAGFALGFIIGWKKSTKVNFGALSNTLIENQRLIKQFHKNIKKGKTAVIRTKPKSGLILPGQF